jgi:hypothetical protein
VKPVELSGKEGISERKNKLDTNSENKNFSLIQNHK